MSQAMTVPPAPYYPAAPSLAPCPPRSPRSPRHLPASPAALWSRATTPRYTGLTRNPLSPSATENSPSPSTPRDYRRFRSPTKRSCPCARNRSGGGTTRPTPPAKSRPIFASPNSTPSVARWATPRRAKARSSSSIGCARIRTGFAIDKIEDVRFLQQTLDLWTGTLHSEFEWRGQKIVVETCCDPTKDMIAVRVRGRIPVVFEFPYGSSGMNAADWSRPDKHTTRQAYAGPNFLSLDRHLDGDFHFVHVDWIGSTAEIKREADHRFVLTPGADQFAFRCAFRYPHGRGFYPDASRG